MQVRKVLFSFSMLAGVFWAAAALRHGEEPSPGVAHVNAAEVETQIVRGDPITKTMGDLTAYVPGELAVRNGAFDLVVHFHGAAANQEKNVTEAGLRAVVVSVNEGGLSAKYSQAFSTASSFERVVDFAQRTVAASGRVDAFEPRPNRIALSSWSAGGAAAKNVLERDADRIDAVILADGIFSRFRDPAAKTVETKPLEPIIDFAERAAKGEKLLVITHTAIPTPPYPNVKECTDVILEEAGIAPSETFTYEVDRGDLHVRGSEGIGPADHIEQIRSLDQAYTLLAKRWAR